MDALIQVLDGREERAMTQCRLLKRADFVLQAALNVPGFPKRMEGDEEALQEALRKFFRSFGTGGRVASPLRLDNGAGLAFLVAYRGRDALEAKRDAVRVETEQAWGRALDLDVMTPGGGLSRKDLGLPPRKCLVCGREAKVCSRLRAHDVRELRKVLAGFLAQGS